MEYKFSDKLASLKPSAIREIFKSLTESHDNKLRSGKPFPFSFPVEAQVLIRGTFLEGLTLAIRN